MTQYYNIYRYSSKPGRKPVLQATGLTREAAEEWCNDPTTSSKTHPRGRNGCKYEWFDGFSKY